MDAVNQKFYVISMKMSKIIVGIVYCWETIVFLVFIFTDEFRYKNEKMLFLIKPNNSV